MFRLLQGAVVCLVLGSIPANAGAVVDVQFRPLSGAVYIGAGAVVGMAGDVWNSLTTNDRLAPITLVDSAGNPTTDQMTWSVQYMVSHLPNSGFDSTIYQNLMDNYLAVVSNEPASTITLTGLAAGNYDLYIYTQGDYASAGRMLTVGVSGLSSETSSSTVATASTFIEGQNYLLFTPTVSSGGTLTMTLSNPAGSNEADMNGFQLVEVAPSSAPEPSSLGMTTFGVLGGLFALRRRRISVRR
jgi:hypothetical protein